MQVRCLNATCGDEFTCCFTCGSYFTNLLGPTMCVHVITVYHLMDRRLAEA